MHLWLHMPFLRGDLATYKLSLDRHLQIRRKLLLWRRPHKTYTWRTNNWTSYRSPWVQRWVQRPSMCANAAAFSLWPCCLLTLWLCYSHIYTVDTSEAEFAQTSPSCLQARALKNQTNTFASQGTDIKAKLQTAKHKAATLRGQIVEVNSYRFMIPSSSQNTAR